MELHGKEKYQNTDNTKIGIKMDNSYWKNEDSLDKRHI